MRAETTRRHPVFQTWVLQNLHVLNSSTLAFASTLYGLVRVGVLRAPQHAAQLSAMVN